MQPNASVSTQQYRRVRLSSRSSLAELPIDWCTHVRALSGHTQWCTHSSNCFGSVNQRTVFPLAGALYTRGRTLQGLAGANGLRGKDGTPGMPGPVGVRLLCPVPPSTPQWSDRSEHSSRTERNQVVPSGRVLPSGPKWLSTAGPLQPDLAVAAQAVLGLSGCAASRHCERELLCVTQSRCSCLVRAQQRYALRRKRQLCVCLCRSDPARTARPVRLVGSAPNPLVVCRTIRSHTHPAHRLGGRAAVRLCGWEGHRWVSRTAH
jgi:hypothetical protein